MSRLRQAAVEIVQGLVRDCGPWFVPFECWGRRRMQISLSGKIRVANPHTETERVLMAVAGHKCWCEGTKRTMGLALARGRLADDGEVIPDNVDITKWLGGPMRLALSMRIFRASTWKDHEPPERTSLRVRYADRMTWIARREMEVVAGISLLSWDLAVRPFGDSCAGPNKNGVFEIRLPLSWLRSVANRGMSVVKDSNGFTWFVIDVAERPEAYGRYPCLAVRRGTRYGDNMVCAGDLMPMLGGGWLLTSRNFYTSPRYCRIHEAFEDGARLIRDGILRWPYPRPARPEDEQAQPGWLMKKLPPDGSPLLRDIIEMGPQRAGAFAYMVGARQVDIAGVGWALFDAGKRLTAGGRRNGSLTIEEPPKDWTTKLSYTDYNPWPDAELEPELEP